MKRKRILKTLKDWAETLNVDVDDFDVGGHLEVRQMIKKHKNEYHMNW